MDCKKEETLRKGPWLEEEDKRLVKFVTLLGERRWDSLARVSGLKRSGKSCRLRWMNYLHPSLKRGPLSQEEEMIIFQLHALWGNKWSKIARRLPGRTDNEVKNYWRTHFRKQGEAQNYEKIIEWRGNKETEITRMTQEQGFNETLKKTNQRRSMESDKETNGAICKRESFGVMKTGFRIGYQKFRQTKVKQVILKIIAVAAMRTTLTLVLGGFKRLGTFEEFSCSLWS